MFWGRAFQLFGSFSQKGLREIFSPCPFLNPEVSRIPKWYGMSMWQDLGPFGPQREVETNCGNDRWRGKSVAKIIKISIDMAPSTGSQSSAQNAAHSCERVPFLALPGLVGPWFITALFSKKLLRSIFVQRSKKQTCQWNSIQQPSVKKIRNDSIPKECAFLHDSLLATMKYLSVSCPGFLNWELRWGQKCAILTIGK